ncbi:MAG: hypothetical protein KatS3mg111_3016 [Pirellulaceae bacterium]|nr:MAG: hypothetical protein KatS3mg111_3016 [Pirellulaceae bacterium]
MTSAEANWFDKLAAAIPGYGAYRDQESRRRDDARTRDYLADRLAEVRHRLTEWMASAATAGDLKVPAQVEPLARRLELAENRLRAAVEGYASWFDEREVDADRLQRVLEHDQNLIALVDQIDQEVARMVAQQELPAASSVTDHVALLEERVGRRSDLLRN